MIGGYFRELVGMETFVYIALYDLEESMEMLGVILLIRVHLKHIQYLHPRLVISLSSETEA
jgi:hypothetical protein